MQKTKLIRINKISKIGIIISLTIVTSITAQIPKTPFPGYAVALVNADSIITQQSYGYANIEAQIPYTINTTQAIGSVSKTVIGIALMKAVELGFVNLDEDINDLLPFKVHNPHCTNEIITLRQLATHTSSIRDRKLVYYFKAYQKGDTCNIALADFLRDYFTPKRKFYSHRNFNSYKPGEAYEYSNIAAALAAYIIEYNSKMSYSLFTTQYIFKPLKMNSTFWNYSKNTDSLRATPYNKHNKSIKPYSLITYPDGGLKTNMNDLSRYLQELIRAYNGNSTLLKPTSWQQIFTPQFKSDSLPLNMDQNEENQGLFLAYRHNHLIGHTGSDPGVCTFMFFDYQRGIGKIFMANKDLDKNNKSTFQQIWKAIDN